MKVGAEARAMARIEGEVQRYQFGPDGDEWVRAQDYADLNEHSALVEMQLQAQIDLNEAYESRLLAEVERLTQAGNYYMSQLADAKDEVERLKKVREDAFHCVNAALRQRGDALEEVERLRGIVQADLEEKAEAWGEVERLRADAERYRWLRTQLEMFGTYDCGFRAPGDVDEACDWGTSHSVADAHK